MSELPELTLEETREKARELLNKGEIDKAVAVMLYYKLGQPDFIEKTTNALIEALKQFQDSNKNVKGDLSIEKKVID